MNRLQRVIVGITVIAVIGQLLFVPWLTQAGTPFRYWWLFSPPRIDRDYPMLPTVGKAIDFARLGVGLLATVLTGACGAWMARRQRT